VDVETEREGMVSDQYVHLSHYCANDMALF
jgi:hypothetical protein